MLDAKDRKYRMSDIYFYLLVFFKFSFWICFWFHIHLWFCTYCAVLEILNFLLHFQDFFFKKDKKPVSNKSTHFPYISEKHFRAQFASTFNKINAKFYIFLLKYSNKKLFFVLWNHVLPQLFRILTSYVTCLLNNKYSFMEFFI